MPEDTTSTPCVRLMAPNRRALFQAWSLLRQDQMNTQRRPDERRPLDAIRPRRPTEK